MNDLGFDDFKQAVVDNIKQFLPDKYEDADIVLKSVLKNNDTMLDAIVIQDPDTNIAPTIYLNSFFEDYKNGKDFDQIVGDIADVHIANAINERMDITFVTDFEQAKDKIMPRLINAEFNQELLADRPHILMDDLAVTYHLEMESSDRGNMSVAITNPILDLYGISKEELHEIALANLEESNSYTFRNLGDVMKDMMIHDMMDTMDIGHEEAEQMLDYMIHTSGVEMYVLTNEDKVLGASAILNEKAMEEVVNQLGEDFYILPSSTHELLIVPKADEVILADLENMVQEVNATQVDPVDKLSDHVYEYDAKEKELFRADKAEEHEQKVEKKHKKEKSVENGKEKVSIKDKITENKEKATDKNKVHEKSQEKKKELAI